MSVPTQPSPIPGGNPGQPGPPQGQPYPGQPGPPGYGFRPQPGSGYQVRPHRPVPQEGEPPRPGQVKLAFWLLLGSAVLAAIAVPVTLGYVNSPEYIAWLGSIIARYAGLEIHAIYLSAGIATLSLSAVMWGTFDIAARVVLASLVRAGYNWARIFVTISAGLSLFALPAMFQAGPASGFLVLAALLISVAAIVLLLGRPSGEYFARMKAFRRARKFSGYPS